MKIEDEVLPGRTKEENAAVAAVVAKLPRVPGPPAQLPSTVAALERHAARALEQAAAQRATQEQLRHGLGAIADRRREELPADAVRVDVGADDDYHDDRRYPVSYTTSDGARGSLGGCPNLGDALARQEQARFDAI